MRFVLGVLLLCWFGPYLLFNDGAIRQDFSIRSETATLALIPTTDRKCTSTWGIFHQCSFNYELNDQPQSQNYNMFAFGSPDSIILLRGVESGRLTSSTGQEYLWNRLFTVIFGMLLSLFTLLGALRKMLAPRPAQQTQEQAYLAQQGGQHRPPMPQQPVQRTPQRAGGARGPSGFGTRTGFSR